MSRRLLGHAPYPLALQSLISLVLLATLLSARPRRAEGGRIRPVGCDPRALELEDRIETFDADRECNEEHHHALVSTGRDILIGLVPTSRLPPHCRPLPVAETSEYARTGFSKKIDVGGRGLQITCLGTGKPPVVLESASGGDSSYFPPILLGV